jgi:hypothetical protein
MEKQQDSIERSIRRIKDALRENSLSPEQISSLKHELSILNQELETRKTIIAKERQKIPKSEDQQKPQQSSSEENDDWRNHCAD